jgi:hypothetical protein
VHSIIIIVLDSRLKKKNKTTHTLLLLLLLPRHHHHHHIYHHHHFNMSVSPRISDPKTPEEVEDAASSSSSSMIIKRKRSPTPTAVAEVVGVASSFVGGGGNNNNNNPVPMAEGIEEVGFRLRAELVRGYDESGVSDCSYYKELRSDIAKHMAGVWTPEITNGSGGLKETIQLINTLFEIAATLATVVVSDDADEQSKLDALHQHSIDGLDLIGGSEGSITTTTMAKLDALNQHSVDGLDQ